MIAGRSPRLIFSHKKRLVQPNFPKYMPFKQVDHFIVLEFDIPTQVSPSPLSTSTSTSTTTQPTAQSAPTPPSFSLQASSSCFPFAGLTFNQSLFQTPRPHADVVPNTSEVVASGLHGGADIHSVAVSAVGIMNLGVKDQAVTRGLATCGGDLDNVDMTDLFTLNTLHSSHDEPFAFEDTGSFALQVCASSSSSYTHRYSPRSHYSSLSFSFPPSPSFSTLFHSLSTFDVSFVQQLYIASPSPPQIVGVPSHCQPTSSPNQSTVYLTPFNTTPIQQNSLAVICGIMASVGEHRCAGPAGVMLTSSLATALPVRGGADALVVMDVRVGDQATNLCGGLQVKTGSFKLYSSFDSFIPQIDNFTLHPSTPFSLYILSFIVLSSLNFNMTYLLSSLLSFSFNNFSFPFSTIPFSFSTLTLSFLFVYFLFKVSSLPAIFFFI